MRRLLVVLNCGMLALGTTAGPLLTRLYYDKGGQRQWLSAWLQSVGWPLLLLPVAASYAARRARDRAAPVLLTPPRVLLAAAGLGVATGADNFIYAYSLRYLPVSTSAILISTQLAFTVFFAFLIVRQRLTPATVNAVALLTAGAAVLGLHVSSDRPAGVTRGKYLLGFALALGAAALYGLILPLVELTYKRAAGGGRAVTYALVMEMQLVMGFFATVFCTVGMIIDKDFQARDDVVTAIGSRLERVIRSGRHRCIQSAVLDSTPRQDAAHGSHPRVRDCVSRGQECAGRAMDVEARKSDAPPARGKAMHRFLVALNCGMLAVGAIGGPLLSRLYFSKGGHRQWLSAWLETGGWPLLVIPVAASFVARRARDRGAPVLLAPPRILLAAAGLGVATGADDFIYAFGLAYLPVSTSAILISTQLAFTVFFAFLVVRQRLTAASVNAVALLTVGAVVLGLHVSSDRPPGVTRGQYWLGFVLTLGAAALYGLVLPLVELAYRRAAGAGGRAVTYALVVEMQLVMGFFATAFCTVGMVVNKDFQAIPREARRYKLGEARYYAVLAWSAVLWQCFFLGAVGVIFCVHTLLAGILIAVFIPVTEVAAVIFLRERFSSEKGVALVLSLWGLASYSYGEWSEARAKKRKTRTEEGAAAAEALQQANP
ncbi:Purine permease 3 [Zea mays]|uniref:Purine permease 3 n=2 Tax=Zea mays TaxID=4577 RepID=A0A1D6I662_MAIZE|nr:Purine permease 3 [Zea mays]